MTAISRTANHVASVSESADHSHARARMSAARALLFVFSMDEREWRVERELMADLQVLAADICSDLKTPLPSSIWGKRREQIAEMRQRIRTLRARHLGSQPWAG